MIFRSLSVSQNFLIFRSHKSSIFWWVNHSYFVFLFIIFCIICFCNILMRLVILFVWLTEVVHDSVAQISIFIIIGPKYEVCDLCFIFILLLHLNQKIKTQLVILKGLYTCTSNHKNIVSKVHIILFMLIVSSFSFTKLFNKIFWYFDGMMMVEHWEIFSNQFSCRSEAKRQLETLDGWWLDPIFMYCVWSLSQNIVLTLLTKWTQKYWDCTSIPSK